MKNNGKILCVENMNCNTEENNCAIIVLSKTYRKVSTMGCGNVNVYGEYEGLWYVDKDYLDYYIAKEADEYGDYDSKMLGDMTAEDFNDYDYDNDLSYLNTIDYINMFVEKMEKRFGSFVSTEEEFGTIMENSLFEIKIVDNEWSYAIELIQKENEYDDYLSGLQKKHYQNYLNGMKDILLGMFPEIGCYGGNPWTHGTITA